MPTSMFCYGHRPSPHLIINTLEKDESKTYKETYGSARPPYVRCNMGKIKPQLSCVKVYILQRTLYITYNTSEKMAFVHY